MVPPAPVSSLLRRVRAARFPLAAPSWPTSVPRPDPERRVGLEYDHEWSRRYPVRLARAMVLDNVARPAARLVAPATLRGLEHLQHLEGPVIFAPNHASHIDTPLLLTTLPVEFRHKTVVAAASDYFFDRTWKSVLWSFALAAIPIERSRVNRRSADTAAELIDDGWNLVIFPEGGRSPDGWTQPFHAASAGYLGKRTGRPVVPVYLHGTRHVLPKTASAATEPLGARGPRRGAGGLRRSPIAVLFGAPMTPDEGENTRRFSERIEAAVAALAREVHSDWWQARRAVSTADPVPGAETAHRGPEAVGVASVLGTRRTAGARAPAGVAGLKTGLRPPAAVSSASPLRLTRQVLHPQLAAGDQFAVALALDLDEPDLLRPARLDGRAGRLHPSGSVGPQEVGGVRHPDDRHVATDLVGRHRRAVAADGFDHRRPHSAVDDPVALLVSLVDVDVRHDTRGRHLFDVDAERAIPAWLRFHTCLLFGAHRIVRRPHGREKPSHRHQTAGLGGWPPRKVGCAVFYTYMRSR